MMMMVAQDDREQLLDASELELETRTTTEGNNIDIDERTAAAEGEPELPADEEASEQKQEINTADHYHPVDASAWVASKEEDGGGSESNEKEDVEEERAAAAAATQERELSKDLAVTASAPVAATPPRPGPRRVLTRSKTVEPPFQEDFVSATFSSNMEDGVAHFLQSRMEGSPFFQSQRSANSLPVLGTDEINLGHLLGQGEFGRVREVIQIVDKAGNDGISRLLRQSRHGSTGTGSSSSHHTTTYGTVGRRSNQQDPPSGQLTTHMTMADESDDGEDSFCNEDGMDDSFPDEPINRSSGTTTTTTTARMSTCISDEASIEFVEIENARRARKVLKKRCWRQGKARYAVKQLREELLVPTDESDEEFQMGTIGAMDLAMEAALLSRLSHSNIVKLRATAGVPGRPDYMLVMDRLYTTLDHQIEEWKLEQPTSNPIKQFLGIGRGRWTITPNNLIAQKRHHRRHHHHKKGKDKDGQDFSRRNTTSNMESTYYYKSNNRTANRLIRQCQLLHRLYAAFDVARALRYLHQNKIAYRDLKPQNIAFDIRGDVRIFDFGLAKELVDADLVKFPDDYNATGMTGSRRWMSPEVYYCEPYGLGADVYSFGLLLWNLCTLQTPFGDNLSLKSHHIKVMVEGQRPKKPRSKLVPENLWTLMTISWSKDRDERPTMDTICDVLREAICTMKMDIQQAIGGGESNKTTAAPLAAVAADEEDENPANCYDPVVGTADSDAAAAAALDGTNATQPMDVSALFGGSRSYSHATTAASTINSSATSSFQSSFSTTSSRRRRGDGPIIKLFGGRKFKGEDPLNVSYHHQPSKQSNQSRAARSQQQWKAGAEQQQAAVANRRRHSCFLLGFQLRNSDLEARSEYLLEKSLRSLANFQTSSAHLDSSAGSRRSSRNLLW